MSVDNTLILDRQHQTDQPAGEIERLHEDWRQAVASLVAARERLDAMRAAAAEQEACVARLGLTESSLRTRLAELRASELPARRPLLLPLLSSLARRARRAVTG